MMFSGCYNLTSVSLPNTIWLIEDGAFMDCSNLTDVYFDGSEERWNNVDIFYENEPLLNAVMHFTDNDPPTEPSIPDVPTSKPSVADLNADNVINATDAALLLSAAASYGAGGGSGMTAEQEIAADVNQDGAFDALDAALVLQYAAYAGAGGTLTIEEFLANNF